MIPLKKFVDDPKEPGEENKDDHGTQVAGKIDALPGFVLQLDCGASENLGYPKMDEQLTIPLQNEWFGLIWGHLYFRKPPIQ